MNRQLAVLSILICMSVMPVHAQQFKVGDRVHSTVSGFDGTVIETGGIDGYVKVSLDGLPQDVANWMNPKWLTAPQGGQQAGNQPQGQAAGNAGMLAQQNGGQQSGPWWNPGAGANNFKVGDRVFSEVSKLYGTITETGDRSGFVKVMIDGSTGSSLLNPKWLKPAGGQAAPGAQAAGQAGGQLGGMPAAPAAAQGGRAGAAGPFAPGSRVEFDRAEGSQPQFGRWDSGTVIGKDQFGRVQIKGDNGTVYNVTDDPRWILPGGSAVPGPRHDAFNKPVTPAPTPNRPVGGAPRNGGGGAAGPFSGEWTVVSLDGQRYEAGAQNFNFVGSRYEILNQGMTMSGNFSVSGNSVQMISDDGTPFATFQYSMQGGQMVLSAPGTQYVLVPAHK
ncbi:MAG: hypothetical protein K2X27_25470 [Candidatus Obscuribacterales bacterium]|nr:hypothetical protein [Candidatus Obscuribacterales bacterium]